MTSTATETPHFDAADKSQVQQHGVAVVAMPQLATYLQPAREQRVQPVKLLQYHILRITMALLSGGISLLTLVSVIANIVLCGRAFTSYYYNGDSFLRAMLVLSLISSVYCFVVMLVCFVVAVKSSRTFLAGSGCASTSLAIAVMVGILLSVVEFLTGGPRFLSYYIAFFGLPMVRLVLMFVYFVLIIVCACTFDKDAQYDDEPEPSVLTYLSA